MIHFLTDHYTYRHAKSKQPPNVAAVTLLKLSTISLQSLTFVLHPLHPYIVASHLCRIHLQERSIIQDIRESFAGSAKSLRLVHQLLA